MVNWNVSKLSNLSATQLYELIQLRINVFVVEQNCPYSELDGKDLIEGVKHLIGTTKCGEVMAYARLLPPGVSYASPSIGRVIVKNTHRTAGMGHQLIAKSVSECEKTWPEQDITISAQQHLQSFYSQHGFKAIGEPYLEDNIPHLKMIRTAS